MKVTEAEIGSKLDKFRKFIKSQLNEFLSFDKDVIRYMSMHWAGGTLLIYSMLVPIFMNKLNISLVNAGIIFSIASIFDVIFTYIMSKFLDKISPNTGMTLDWLTESLPAIIYGFAATNIHFLFGALASKMTNILNPVYKVYENEIYPEEKRSLIYTYHIITPEVFTIIMYPLVGYLLSYKFTNIMAFRVIFWICGIGYLFVALIPYKGLRWVKPVEISKDKKTIKLPKNLRMGALAHILIFVGLGLISTLLTSYYILDTMNGTIMDIMMLEAIGALIVLITGLFTKNLNSWISEEKIAQYGIVFFMIFAILMAIGKSYSIIVIAYIFKAIGNTVWFPNHYTLLMKYVPREKSGEFFGSISAISKFLDMSLPLISGILAKKFGFFVPFLLAFVAFIMAGIVYQKLVKEI
jgi:MFS family permease